MQKPTQTQLLAEVLKKIVLSTDKLEDPSLMELKSSFLSDVDDLITKYAPKFMSAADLSDIESKEPITESDIRVSAAGDLLPSSDMNTETNVVPYSLYVEEGHTGTTLYDSENNPIIDVIIEMQQNSPAVLIGLGGDTLMAVHAVDDSLLVRPIHREDCFRGTHSDIDPEAKNILKLHY